MESGRKYQFTWDLLGDIELGRPHLGNTTRVEIYRLMQFTFRDVVEQHLGTEQADFFFREAGRLAGKQFYDHVVGRMTELDRLVSSLQKAFKDLGVGILRLEKADPDDLSFVFTVSEDLDCSGLPELGYQVCVYDEGFIAGILEGFSGKRFEVREEDCWSNGDRTCRFVARVGE